MHRIRLATGLILLLAITNAAQAEDAKPTSPAEPKKFVRVVKYNNQEAKALLTMIDKAVRAGGLEVAAAAAYLAEKIQSAPVEPASDP